MPFEFFLARATKCCALIYRYVIANDRGFSDDNAHAVINEQSPTNLRCRMNLDARQEPGDLGELWESLRLWKTYAAKTGSERSAFSALIHA
jgi:hypothetical protein